jgi:hypothetical protein
MPTNPLKRFLVCGYDDEGDALDFFFDAETPEEAKSMWLAYLEGPDWELDLEYVEYTATWEIRPAGTTKGFCKWDHENGVVA